VSTVPTPINAELVMAAITALAPFYPKDREQVADLLLFWVRRHELTVADLVEVQDRMFPECEPALIDPPACPVWCDDEHRGDRVVPEIRECSSGQVVVKDLRGDMIVVDVARVFDRITGRFSRVPHLRVEDLELTVRGARTLALELLTLADVLDD
jgi:hypothetical protein